jgi:hypothetical protein
MSTPYQQVSKDANRAIEEFSDQFRGALTLTEPDNWDDAGLSYTLANAAAQVTFPLPVDAAGYKEFKGEIKYRQLYTRSMSFRTKEWSDGVREKARVIESDQFSGWLQAPQNMARAWRQLPLTLLAALLQGDAPGTNAPAAYTGPLLDLYKDKDSNTASTVTLFADAHPCNVFEPAYGTFDNLRTTTHADLANGNWYKDLCTYAATVRGANGMPLDVSVTGSKLLNPTSLTHEFKAYLENDTLITAISNAGVQNATANVVAAGNRKNLAYGQISAHEVKEFSVANGWDQVFFVVLGGNTELYPWVALADGAPEERLFDKSSEHYRNTGEVKVGYIGNANVGAAMPHRIVRYQFTA